MTPKRRLLSVLVMATWALGAEPAHAVQIYMNSYGWSQVYRYDTITGATVDITPTNTLSTAFCSEADFGPDGNLYAGTGFNIYKINFSGSQAVWTPYLTLTQQINDGLAFSPSGTLYLADNPSGSTILWAVNSSGTTIPGSSVNVTYNGNSVSLSGIDFSPSGTLYGADSTHIYRINLSTGVSTLLATEPNENGGIFTELDYGSDGIIRALGSFNYLYDYNPQSGANGWEANQLLYNGSSFSPSSLASTGNFAAVPEPATWVELVIGAVIAPWMVWWRRKRLRSRSSRTCRQGG